MKAKLFGVIAALALLAMNSAGILSGAAWADDKQDQKNIYDVLRTILKPSPNVSIDEEVTALIKRHMANLLYPVDMTTFAKPEDDAKFRDLIIVLQKQMGAQATGVLTSDQFDRLSQAAHDINARFAVPSTAKFVTMKNDDYIIASGTGTMDDIAFPINKVHIYCWKRDGSCEYREASFDLKTNLLDLTDAVYYDIKTWTPTRVTAIREHPCGTASMTIDVKAEDVTITSVPHADVTSCPNNGPSIWTLAKGFDVAWKLHRDGIDKAKKLIYPPAEKFMENQ
jgi:hypothetical protein